MKVKAKQLTKNEKETEKQKNLARKISEKFR